MRVVILPRGIVRPASYQFLDREYVVELEVYVKSFAVASEEHVYQIISLQPASSPPE